MGGTTVALYGKELNKAIRKQQGASGKLSEDEIILPAEINSFGSVLNFANLNTSQFEFTPSASPAPNTANTYIQLIFTSNYQTPNTKFSGWNPASVAGLSLWLDSVEPGANGFGPNTGTPMSNWTDKSGRNNHGSSSSAPTYQVNPTLTGAYKMGMYLNGTSSFFSGSIKNDMNYCAVFSVVAPDAGVGTGSRIISLGAAGISDTTGTNIYTNVVYNSTTSGANILSSVGTVNNTEMLSRTLVPIPAENSAFITASVVTNSSVVSLANGTSTFLCRGSMVAGSGVLNVSSIPSGGIIYINSVITGPYNSDTEPIQSGGQVPANTLITDMSIRTNGGLGAYTVNIMNSINTRYLAISNTLPTSNVEWRSNLNLNTYSVGRNNSGTDFFKGYVHEVLVYTRTISKQASQTIEGYLAWKWGLQANLPSTHPYKSVAPGPYSLSVPIPLIFNRVKPLLWLDAQDPLANDGTLFPAPNTPMTGWYDKSGNNNHGVAISTFAPTYRANSVVFNGSTTLNATATVKVRPREIISDLPGIVEQPRSCIAFYPNGDAIITNSGKGMIKNVIGGTATTFKSGLLTPTGIIFDSKWNMYVVENSGHRIRRYGPAPNYDTDVIIAGDINGTSGVANEPYFTLVTGYIASNILYVNSFTNASGLTNPIRLGLNIVSTSSSHGTISSFGSDTIGGIGTYNLVGNVNNAGSIASPQTITVFGRGGPIKGSQARFNRPSGITIDKNDIIYITDQNNHCIRRIYLNPNSEPTIADNWTVETIAGGWNSNNKTYGNNTGSLNDVSGDTALFNSPVDITVDPTATFLYVADKVNNRIRKINISTRFVSNCPNFTSTPRAITCDEFGILYIPLENVTPARIEVYNTEQTLYGSPLISEIVGAEGEGIYLGSNSITYFNNTIYYCNEGGVRFYSLRVPRPTYLYSPVTTPISTVVNAFVVCTNSGFNRNVTGILSLASATNVETYTGAHGIGGSISNILEGTGLLLPEDAGPSSSYIGLYNNLGTRMVTRKNTQVNRALADRPLLETLDITRPPDLLYVSSNPTSISIRVNGGTASSYTNTYLPFNIGAYGIGMQPSNIRRLSTLLRTNSAAAMRYSFDGYVYEVIVYTNEMTAYQFKIVEAYLSWKWRIPLVDTTNPYFTSATTPANLPLAYIDTVPTAITNMVFSNVLSSCSFTGSITDTTLTVTAISAVSATNIGRIEIGAALNTASGGTITAFVSGTLGGIGVYRVSVSQTVASSTIISSRNFSCIFIGSITNTSLTVTKIISGTIYIGALLHTSAGGNIFAFVSGTNGGVGVYTISQSQTVSSGTSMATSVAFTLSWKGGAQATNYRYTLTENTTLKPTYPVADFGMINQSISYRESIDRTLYYYTVEVTPRNFAGTGTSRTAILLQTPVVPTRSSPSLTGFTIATTVVALASSYNVYFDDIQYRQITSGTTAAFTNLLSGKDYLVTTTAVSSTGHESPRSPVLIARTLPTAPSNITISDWVAGGFTLSWSGAVGATNFVITGATPTTPPVLVNGISNNLARFTGLNSNTAYTITIKARNAGNDESPTVGTISIPVAPTLTSDTLTTTGFTLTFTAVPGASSYIVYIGEIKWTLSPILATGTVITGQPQGAKLNVTVAAVVNGIEMWPSPVLLVSLPLPPLTNFRTYDMTDSEFKLSWLGGDGANNYLWTIAPGGALRLPTGNDFGVTSRYARFTTGRVDTTYTITIQGVSSLTPDSVWGGTNPSATGTSSMVRGRITNNFIIVSQVISGQVAVPSCLLTTLGGRITTFISGTNGGIGTYSLQGLNTQDLPTGTDIRIAAANSIIIYHAAIVYRNTAVEPTSSGFSIAMPNLWGPNRFNIYGSSNNGVTYNLILSNQAIQSPAVNYTVNVNSVFIGSITNNSLAVTSITSGAVYINAYLIEPDGVKITGFVSGTNGGVGVYTVTTTPDLSSRTFTAKCFGVNLYLVAKYLDSNGVEGWGRTDSLVVFQQRIAPSEPTNVRVSFPNITTNQATFVLSWSGGYGATISHFVATNTGTPTRTANSITATASNSQSYTKITFYMLSELVSSSSVNAKSSTMTITIPKAPANMGQYVTGTVRRPREITYLFPSVPNTAGEPVISSYNIYVDGVLNMNTTTHANTIITLPAATITVLINVRAVDASGNLGYPSATFTATLLAPTAPVIGVQMGVGSTGIVGGNYAMPWTGADAADTITMSYTNTPTAAQPTINLAAKTASFTGLSARSLYTGTMIATNDVGSSSTVKWGINSYKCSTIYNAGVLASLQGVAVDSSGNVYFSESSRHIIRKLTPDASGTTYTVTTIAGTGGAAGSTGDNNAATSALLSYPNGVALDSSRNIYITDNGRIRKITVSTGIISAITFTPATPAISNPAGIALDSTGNIYITETVGGHRIRKLTPPASGTTYTSEIIAGTGTSGSAVDNISATLATFNTPRGIALDSSGNIYIADTVNQRIRKITVSTGIITNIAGNGTTNYTGEDVDARTVALNSPRGVTVDSTGNVYVCDTNRSRIRKLIPDAGIYKVVTFTGIDGVSNAIDWNYALIAQFTYPNGIALDSAGNMYIADGELRIRKLF